MAGTRLLALAGTAILAATGGLAFVPLTEPRALAAVPFAAVLPTMIVAARRRGSLPIAIAGWVIAGPPVALAFGVGTASVADTVRGGVVDGFRLALTSALPLPATPAVLFWIFTLVWWAAYWAARAAALEVAPLLMLLPPALVLLTGVAFGVAAPGSGLPVAVLFAGAAAFLLAVRGGAGPRRMAAAVVTCSAVVLGAVSIAPRLPYEGRRAAFDPRALVHQPQRIQTQLSPLALATLWAAEPPRRLFEVTTNTPVNQRLAVFDGYDGLDWGSSASYIPIGARVPDGGIRTGHPVRESVTVGELPLSWLPAPDRPTGVTGTLVRADRPTGVLTTADGHAATGRRYTVTARVPDLTARQAVTADPEYGPSYAGTLKVPADVPLSLTLDADRLTRNDTAPYQRLLTLQNRLRTHYRYDVRAAPGRTVGHLRFFYEKSRRGTADQFATAFALMARHLGFPARVTVGFGPGHPTGPGRYEVTTSDVVVWPEVALRGLGWVPFYPVPRPSAGGTTVGRSVGEPPARAALDQAVAAARPAPATPPARPVPQGPVRPPGDRPAYEWALGVGVLLALAIGYLVPGPAVRAWVRHRRRSGTPYDRVVGAWQEATGLLARLPGAGGPAALTAMTAEEVAERARGWLGGDAGTQTASLARHLSAAVFSARRTDEVDAEAAWLITARLRTRVDREIATSRRIREFLRPPWTATRAALRRPASAMAARTPVKETQ